MTDPRWPSVSVVVPTVGRPELVDAVRSVLAQDYPGQVEAVVVVDGDAGAAADLGRWHTEGVRLVRTAGRRGAGAARNLGVRTGHGELVAFLDDDDVWDPTKLRTQVTSRAALPDPHRVVTSCRVRWRRPGQTGMSRPVPDLLPPPEMPVEDYLFRRRRPSLARAVIPTPTLLTTRELAVAVPWDEGLPRHQDWDWLLRAQETVDARVVMCPEALIVCTTGSSDSISAGADWRASLRWCSDRSRTWSARTRVDFLVGQPLRYALQDRSGRGAATVLARAAATRRLPSWQAVAVGASGLLPRRAFERAALLSGRVS